MKVKHNRCEFEFVVGDWDNGDRTYNWVARRKQDLDLSGNPIPGLYIGIGDSPLSAIISLCEIIEQDRDTQI